MHCFRAAALSLLLASCSSSSPSAPPVFADRPVLPGDAVSDAVVDAPPIACPAEGAPCRCAGGATGVTHCLGPMTMCVCDPVRDAGVDATLDGGATDRPDTTPDAPADVARDAALTDARPLDVPTVVDGCAADTSTDLNNCGACGHVCTAPANARPFCALGGCSWACNALYGDCDGNPANGCESSLRTVAHCGTCGGSCDQTNAVATCTADARCAVVSCMTGFDDCDHDPATGCEADLGFDRLHCGTCTHVCPVACVDGACSS